MTTIGVIADTHMPGSISELWPQIVSVFANVDLILHAGDLHTTDVIEQLARIAPTYVARGNGDVGVEHPQLQDTWLLELGGQQIAMVHEFPSPSRASATKINKRLARHFGEQRPAAVIYGHTHFEEQHTTDGTLFLNPGSATLPRNQSTRLGTFAQLTITADDIHSQLFQLTTHGAEQLGEPLILNTALGGQD